MAPSPISHRDELVAILHTMAADGRRRLVAIAGAPGSGKSTLTAALESELNAMRHGFAAVLGMDGFHFDDAILRERGILARKGAPHTFDVDGLASTLARLRAAERDVAVPVFDRDLELSRASARIVARDTPLILVEGNYLLLRQEPWRQLHNAFDVTVMLDVDMATLERRLRDRWLGYGFSGTDIERKVMENDLPNARAVISGSIEADHVAAL